MSALIYVLGHIKCTHNMCEAIEAYLVKFQGWWKPYSLFPCALDEYLLKIDLMDWTGEKNYALYDNFRISDEKVSFSILPTHQ